MAPGGLVILLEATTKERFADLTVGFTEGWWAFDDEDLRPDYALLTRERWVELFNDSGFEAAVALPQVASGDPREREAVIVARRPASDAAATSSLPRRDRERFILVDDGALGALVAEALGRFGARAETIDAAQVEGSLAGRLTAVAESLGGPADVVFLNDAVLDGDGAASVPDAVDLREDQRRRTETWLAILQATLENDRLERVRLVTRGGQAVGGASATDVAPEAGDRVGRGSHRDPRTCGTRCPRHRSRSAGVR